MTNISEKKDVPGLSVPSMQSCRNLYSGSRNAILMQKLFLTNFFNPKFALYLHMSSCEQLDAELSFAQECMV